MDPLAEYKDGVECDKDLGIEVQLEAPGRIGSAICLRKALHNPRPARDESDHQGAGFVVGIRFLCEAAGLITQYQIAEMHTETTASV